MKLTKEQRIAAGKMLAEAVGNNRFNLIAKLEEILQYDQPETIDQGVVEAMSAAYQNVLGVKEGTLFSPFVIKGMTAAAQVLVEHIRPRMRKRIKDTLLAGTAIIAIAAIDDELTKCLAPQEKTLARKMADYLRDNGDKSCEKQACDLAAIAHKESENAE